MIQIRRCLAPLAAVAFALGLAAPAAAIDVPLKFARLGDSTAQFMATGIHSFDLTGEKPQGCKLPKFLAPRPAFGALTLCGQTVPFALDIKSKDDKFYNRLYFDQNGNNDLTDDTPISGISNVSTLITISVFEPADLQLKQAGATRPYTCRLQVMHMGAPDLAKLDFDRLNGMMGACCSYTGEFKTGNRTWRISLLDADFNGTFDEFAKLVSAEQLASDDNALHVSGDQFVITSSPETPIGESLPLGRNLVLDGKPYRVAVDISKPLLTLTPIEKNVATLGLPEKVAQFSLIGDKADDCLVVSQPGKTITVPAGKYRVLNYAMTLDTKTSGSWLVASQATKDTPLLEAAAGKTIDIALGPPFTVKARVPESELKSTAGAVSLQFVNTDAAGLSVATFQRIAAPSFLAGLFQSDRPDTPKYTIKNAKGELVAQGQFEYG